MVNILKDVIKQAIDFAYLDGPFTKVDPDEIAQAVLDRFDEIATQQGYLKGIDRQLGYRIWPMPELRLPTWVIAEALHINSQVLVLCANPQEMKALLQDAERMAIRLIGEGAIKRRSLMAGHGEIQLVDAGRIVFIPDSKASHGYGRDWLRVRAVRP